MPVHASGGEGQRRKEREIESETHSVLSVKPDTDLDLNTVKSQPELQPRVGCLTD